MTPEQEEQVRRALAALGEPSGAEPAPLPSHVAARLDATLADLLAERSDDSAAEAVAPADAGRQDQPDPRPSGPTVEAGDAHGDELAIRRGRRTRVLLAAAAAVVVVAGGIAAGQLATRGGSSSDSSASSATGGRAAPGEAGGSAPPSAAGGRLDRRPAAIASPNGPSPDRPVGVPRLHTATLRRDVERLVTSVDGATRAPGASACQTPSTGPGDRLLAVRLDGRRATLVLGSPALGRRTARVYSCADPGAPVASATVRDAP